MMSMVSTWYVLGLTVYFPKKKKTKEKTGKLLIRLIIYPVLFYYIRCKQKIYTNDFFFTNFAWFFHTKDQLNGFHQSSPLFDSLARTLIINCCTCKYDKLSTAHFLSYFTLPTAARALIFSYGMHVHCANFRTWYQSITQSCSMLLNFLHFGVQWKNITLKILCWDTLNVAIR